MGRSLVKAALSHGDIVTAVGRTQESTMKQMERWHERCLGLLCDVRVRKTVDAVIQTTIREKGKVDIIVNCTGYGIIGSCEDQDEATLRSQFETNFLGTLNIIQLSLPYFRSVSAGRYLIFSSTSGALGVPGLGPYCATKYAVEGLIESMLYEVDTFGIKATLVQPGHVRLNEPELWESHDTAANTQLAGSKTKPDGKSRFVQDTNPAVPVSATRFASLPIDSQPLPRYGHFLIANPSPPYAGPNAPAGHAQRIVQWLNDRQPVSAVKSAELVWQLGHCKYPPLRLLLGNYAVECVRDRLRSIIEELRQIEDWKHLSFPVAVEDEMKDDAPDEQMELDEQNEEN
ncbi:1,2-dihydroxy-3-keto-5-methylthiopentene dioxygenase [Elasticomyces elasticus]|nr:1,2-dihydroxy-3-keto-5-methylthiopentene dioxygenase [Elasticomyces elasticus]KAK4992955.1 1,2-dihydroxy-3-keto-5-methylthiopentene dioxygenase [Elasticomyces elasticus]